MKGSTNSRTALSAAVITTLALSAGLTAPMALSKSIDGDAIIGTGRSKVSSDAIIGTGRTIKPEAIIGTGRTAQADAIIGTGRSADDGDAIIGTGKTQVFLAGPIDSFDRNRGTISIFGRVMQVAKESTSTTQMFDALEGGAAIQIAVSGRLERNGRLSNTNAYVLKTPYVAGASKITLTGRISAIDASTGRALVGKSIVDFSAINGSRSIAIGDVITMSGTMPQFGQPILAETIHNHEI